MSDSDVPADQSGGLSNVSEAPELPERLRVHALARLIERTSRQVLDVLDRLGVPARGVQSSIDRATAIRVIETLSEADAGEPPTAQPATTTPTTTTPTTTTPTTTTPTTTTPTTTPTPSATRGPDENAEPTQPGLGAVGPGQPAEVPPSEERDESRPVSPTVPEAPAAPLPLFAAPSPMFLPPEPTVASRISPAPSAVGGEAGDTGGTGPAESVVAGEMSETKRRRRRGRRGRGRGRGSEDAEDQTARSADAADGGEAAGSASATEAQATAGSGEGVADSQIGTAIGTEIGPENGTESGTEIGPENGTEAGPEVVGTEVETVSTTRRRRRRRRRKESVEAVEAEADSEEAATLTRVREPRANGGEMSDSSGIQGVRGSTRLEAKRQRRRDGRDAGRRRAPVLSEAEFLARRESVERTMVVRQQGERSEIGVLEDGVLVEHFVTSSGGSSLVGNVYLGRVQNVLPSMEAAFVDIGRGRNAVLYAGEVDWDAAGLAGKARRIEQALASGDNILVQVTKDPVGHKGARLTTQISLPGRFLVYVPSGGTHGISRKLPDTERRRLKDLLKEIVPDDAGVIIRTASEGVSQEALERDVRRLQAQWEVVRNKAEAAKNGKSKAPELLYEEPDLMIKVVRDQFNEDFSKLVVQGDDAWDTLHAYISHVAPELTDRLHRHVGTTDVFTEYRIDEQLLKALDRKVWLPSGGTLVIDRTEAMTVIDVNTGKFTGSGGNLEETVTRNNLEAAEEIVRQLRLRDIGGIIVIDFIDMVLESNRDLVLRRLTECLGRDRTRHQVAEVTSLGLVQMTRKRVGMGLLEAFSTPCEHCRGRGVLVSSEPVEPKGDHGQHGYGAGRRRNRGGEARGGEHTEAAGGGNGRRGRPAGGINAGVNAGQAASTSADASAQAGALSGAEGDVANGQRRPSPAPGPANGRPIPTAPPRPSAAPVTPSGTSASESGATVTDLTGSTPPTSVGESGAGAESDRVAPAVAVAGTPPVAEAAPGQSEGSTTGPLASVPAVGPTIDPGRPELADQRVSPQPWQTTSIGGSSAQPARTVRRRRRVASRPAGPPSQGEGGPDPV